MQFWRSQRWWIITLLISGLFVFLRLYKIETSLLFFNDIGRDFLELWNWQHTGKPPLLGPQTSALPFNQSAVYFYLLMPGFLLFQGSLLATIYTAVGVYLVLLWVGTLWLRQKHHHLLPIFWIIATLFAIQPELIIQHRFVWNPSFLTGWLMLSVLMSWQLVATPPTKWRWWWIWLWGLGLALAVSFSYSAVPAVFVALVLTIVWWRAAAWKLWLTTVMSLAALNLPTGFFELRHGFLLTKMMFFGPWIKQIPSTLLSRYQDLWHYLMGTQAWWAQGIWLAWLGLVVALLIQQVWLWQQQKNLTDRSPLFIWTASWWLVTVALALVMPVAIQSHYIFPVVTLGIASLGLLPHKLKWGLIGGLVLIWLQPSQLQSYWQPARHTLAELSDCSAKICTAVKGPVFVSNQASAHPYHNAMEYQYLLRKAGCDLKDLANFPDSAQQMVVVLDDSVYEHGKTAFNELTLFGKSQEITRLQCQSNLEVVLLQKNL